MGLIKRAYQQTGRQVVVLIDEYDAPLLDVPNKEVRVGLMESLVPHYVTPDTLVTNNVIADMAECLFDDDMDGALRKLQT